VHRFCAYWKNDGNEKKHKPLVEMSFKKAGKKKNIK